MKIRVVFDCDGNSDPGEYILDQNIIGREFAKAVAGYAKFPLTTSARTRRKVSLILFGLAQCPAAFASPYIFFPSATIMSSSTRAPGELSWLTHKVVLAGRQSPK